ncbi:lysozyme [Pseudooceanicola sp. 200-1SW]
MDFGPAASVRRARARARAWPLFGAEQAGGNVGIATICTGHTEGVALGDTATAEDCREMFLAEVMAFETRIRPCLPEVLPDQSRAAFVSAAYNIGAGAFCGSSMSRRALAGDLAGACDALLMWNKARVQGVLRPVTGLTRRRQAERALCREGLGA